MLDNNQNNKRVYHSLMDLIGNVNNPTPIIILSDRINPFPNFTIGVKLEKYNIFGSIKDRVALKMILGANIAPGQSILEASSGNTAIALACLGNALGIPVEIVVPEKIPEEKKKLLKLLGVTELWEAEDALCPLFPDEGARGLAKSLAESPAYKNKYVYLNQYENELNIEAHYQSTGPEIWNQLNGKVDYFFAGFGTCATITGVGRFLKEKNPNVKIIGVEPARSDHKLPGMKKISELAEEYVPGIFDKSIIDDIIEVDDDDAFQTGIMLARKGGLLVGPTTGAIAYAALKYGETESGVGVMVSPDDAFKYTSFYEPYLDKESEYSMVKNQ
ncbi:MAG: PLP-dependent cysteine synthase family protein [Candidatus Marinimicrobia bacterium]|nr:PLP-dependent cysteine synthase family protein [Candidatus Neomarinimicrobiota bacterium]